MTNINNRVLDVPDLRALSNMIENRSLLRQFIRGAGTNSVVPERLDAIRFIYDMPIINDINNHQVRENTVAQAIRVIQNPSIVLTSEDTLDLILKGNHEVHDALIAHRQAQLRQDPNLIDALVDIASDSTSILLCRTSLPISQNSIDLIWSDSSVDNDGMQIREELLASHRLDNPAIISNGRIQNFIEEIRRSIERAPESDEANNLLNGVTRIGEQYYQMQERREAAAAVRRQAVYGGIRVRRENQRGRARDAEPENERDVRQRR